MPFTTSLREDNYERWANAILTPWTICLRDQNYLKGNWEYINAKLDGIHAGLIYCADLLHSKDNKKVYDLIAEDISFLRVLREIAEWHAAHAPRNPRNIMKIIQIMTDNQDGLTALTDDGRIFHGYWSTDHFEWFAELTPDEIELQHLRYNVKYKGKDEI